MGFKTRCNATRRGAIMVKDAIRSFVPRDARQACSQSAAVLGPSVTTSCYACADSIPPRPGILPGGDLRRGLLPALLSQAHMVRRVSVKRGGQIDTVDARGWDVLPKDGEVITKGELVLPLVFHRSPS